MDVLVVALRPKNTVTVLSEYRPKNFDILMVDIRTSTTDKSKTLKQLPKCSTAVGNDPTRQLSEFLYQLTGHDNGGIRAKRAMILPMQATSEFKDLNKGSLWCVIIDPKAKLNPAHVDNIPSTPGFYQLDYVLDSCKTNSSIYSRLTRYVISKFDNWLREKYTTPGAIETLLSSPPHERARRSVHNPAFITSFNSAGGVDSSSRGSSLAREVHTKMLAIEKCDIVIMNNVYGSSQTCKHKVDAIAVNHYWGMGIPDVDQMSVASPPKSGDFLHPLHHYACKGDLISVRQILRSNYQLASELDRNSWAPLHYAACYGHVEVVRALVEEGQCSPNILTDNLSTPLHFAAVHGHPGVVRYLLESKNIDLNAPDKDGRSALDLCEKVSRQNYKECTRLLKEARERPYQKIKVLMMDGKTQTPDLVSGDNTTAQQLNTQIMQNLGLPKECSDMFTIWICSKNLQLQLKWDHRPKQHLHDWKNVVKLYTDFDASKEEPKLYWKRDARLSVTKERKNRNIKATHLLFHEAYHCYIKGYFPCAEQDAIILGATVMLLEHGTYESKKAKSALVDKNLPFLVPDALVKFSNKSHKYWSGKVLSKYKGLSSQFTSPTPQFLQYYFLLVCWNLKVYGSAFFSGFLQPRAGMRSSSSLDFVHVGINDIGIHIIDGQSKMMIHSFDYSSINWSQWKPPDGTHLYLKVTLKNAPRGQASVYVRTKQAELVFQLMSMLNELSRSG